MYANRVVTGEQYFQINKLKKTNAKITNKELKYFCLPNKSQCTSCKYVVSKKLFNIRLMYFINTYSRCTLQYKKRKCYVHFDISVTVQNVIHTHVHTLQKSNNMNLALK